MQIAIGVGLDFLRSASAPEPPYDTDAQALFSRMTVQPAPQRKQLISDLFISGKAKSFWGKLDALWVTAAHDEQAGRLNWLAAAYTCLPINGPAFTVDRGFAGKVTEMAYLDTQFNPATAVIPKFTQNSASFGIRTNVDDTGASLMGFFGNNTLRPRNLSTNIVEVRINAATNLSSPAGTSPSGIGLFAANRPDSATAQAYRNGVNVVGGARASAAPANGNFRIGSISDASFNASEFSMAFIGAGLTSQEHADLFAWFEPYRTALGII